MGRDMHAFNALIAGVVMLPTWTKDENIFYQTRKLISPMGKTIYLTL